MYICMGLCVKCWECVIVGFLRNWDYFFLSVRILVYLGFSLRFPLSCCVTLFLALDLGIIDYTSFLDSIITTLRVAIVTGRSRDGCFRGKSTRSTERKVNDVGRARLTRLSLPKLELSMNIRLDCISYWDASKFL